MMLCYECAKMEFEVFGLYYSDHLSIMTCYLVQTTLFIIWYIVWLIVQLTIHNERACHAHGHRRIAICQGMFVGFEIQTGCWIF